MTAVESSQGSVTTEADVHRLIDELLTEYPPATTDIHVFLGAQWDKGLAWVHFDRGYGGLGLNPGVQQIINGRLLAAGAPDPRMRNPIGHGMGAPTVYTWGSEAQKRRYLRPLFTGEEVWCQLFSEPGAGSDVASLATRAVRDGDEWIVNGQKVWTTLAHLARWGMLVARTDTEAVKHAGLSYFVVDMHAPGVEVRPLRQMTGEAEFNEVYFTDARVPDAERLGNVGDGWRVSLTTLMNERVSIGGATPPRGSGPIGEAVEVWNALPADRKDAATLDELMQLWCEAEAMRLTNIRAGQSATRGTPGPEGSIGKMMFAESNKRVYAFIMNLMGAEGMLYGSYEFVRPTMAGAHGDDLHKRFLRARANSIEGGTTEVMRNILGERMLGLPGDVRVDKDLPWSQVPRN
ncbi:MAG: acyl-CoA dehydrogenase family protein [Acidimicrobiia bacterium]